ncbi:cellulase family glycosylhydrolase [Stenomitos frigidus]|uniref:Endoglucanase n=1 Tax=Stenomitos frigidus ULC18 TaxID=2107698 RepID=A0A2T1DVS0_9CYAN|nr:cellulase family glycosylhydrolase [Stenomitos frigidus]PSB24595.1 glycoside hydrolase [Stenomitos frigidus ULC18]
MIQLERWLRWLGTAVKPLQRVCIKDGWRSLAAAALHTKTGNLRQKRLRWLWGGLFLSTIVLSLALHRLNPADAAVVQFPLSTKGAQIVDASGQPVLLRGVNWFGIETETQVPHGLWARDYKEMLAQIKSLGYNLIRLPYAVQSLRASTINGVDFTIGNNRDLQGKTPLEVMDLIIQEAQRQGLMILLDSHRLNNQRIPELWYGDGFTEADWVDTWKLLATRYQKQPNVIGADLKNEPHGRASWGTNDRATDWRLAAERAGNAVLAIAPHWLIVVEGVERNVPGQKLARHWQGGNLEGAGRYPVRLNKARKLVYSPHEYGPGVYNQPWFSEAAFPKNLLNRWEVGFNYLASRNIAPILIGEFGGRQVDASSKEGLWHRQLVNFIQQKKLHFTYWSWNPNSSDTGGILQDDWRTVDQAKQQLLSQLLTVPGPTALALSVRQSVSPLAPLVAPTLPSPRPTGEIVPSSADGQLEVQATMQSDWQTGFCTAIRVTNHTKLSRRNWRLKFQMNQATIRNSWNGTFAHQGSRYTVDPPEWGRVLEPNQSIDLGFCAAKQGVDYRLKKLAVSGL